MNHVARDANGSLTKQDNWDEMGLFARFGSWYFGAELPYSRAN